MAVTEDDARRQRHADRNAALAYLAQAEELLERGRLLRERLAERWEHLEDEHDVPQEAGPL